MQLLALLKAASDPFCVITISNEVISDITLIWLLSRGLAWQSMNNNNGAKGSLTSGIKQSLSYLN